MNWHDPYVRTPGLAASIRGVLAEGPASIEEIMLELELNARTTQVGMWILTSEKQAEKCGVLPKGEGQKRPHSLYRLTKKGELIHAQSAAADGAVKTMKLTEQQRLDRIAEIIERVDNRALYADGPVPKTRHEMTDEEFREIYRLAKGKPSKAGRGRGL